MKKITRSMLCVNRVGAPVLFKRSFLFLFPKVWYSPFPFVTRTGFWELLLFPKWIDSASEVGNARYLLAVSSEPLRLSRGDSPNLFSVFRFLIILRMNIQTTVLKRSVKKTLRRLLGPSYFKFCRYVVSWFSEVWEMGREPVKVLPLTTVVIDKIYFERPSIAIW